MTKFYWYKNCPKCSQGRLIICENLDKKILYFHCEECEYGFLSKREVVKNRGFLTLLEEFQSEIASWESIKNYGWESYAIESFIENE